MQWNLRIMDTLIRTSKMCPDYQGVLIFQFILYQFGTQLSVWVMHAGACTYF